MSVGIAIFVKTPGHSPVKTRLAAAGGRDFAESWHRLSSRAVAECVLAFADNPRAAAYWAVAETEAAGDPLWSGLTVLEQGEGGLGTRMARVHDQLLKRHGAAILLGADTPQLRPGRLIGAVTWLGRKDARIVLGPSADGGFWLFGSNRPVPATVWSDTPWSRAETAEVFRRNLQKQCPGKWRLLETLADLDRLSDLEQVRRELDAIPQPLPAQRELIEWLAGSVGTRSLHQPINQRFP